MYYFTIFLLVQLLQKLRTIQEPKAFKLRKKMKNSPSCVHVLHKTLNLVISCCCFAENGKEMQYPNVKRMCRATVFPHYTYCLAVLSLPLSLLKIKFPILSLRGGKQSLCIIAHNLRLSEDIIAIVSKWYFNYHNTITIGKMTPTVTPAVLTVSILPYWAAKSRGDSCRLLRT